MNFDLPLILIKYTIIRREPLKDIEDSNATVISYAQQSWIVMVPSAMAWIGASIDSWQWPHQLTLQLRRLPQLLRNRRTVDELKMIMI